MLSTPAKESLAMSMPNTAGLYDPLAIDRSYVGIKWLRQGVTPFDGAVNDLPCVGRGVADVVRTEPDHWTVLLMELVLPVHILPLQEFVPIWNAADGTGPRPGNAGQWMAF